MKGLKISQPFMQNRVRQMNGSDWSNTKFITNDRPPLVNSWSGGFPKPSKSSFKATFSWSPKSKIHCGPHHNNSQLDRRGSRTLAKTKKVKKVKRAKQFLQWNAATSRGLAWTWTRVLCSSLDQTSKSNSLVWNKIQNKLLWWTGLHLWEGPRCRAKP